QVREPGAVDRPTADDGQLFDNSKVTTPRQLAEVEHRQEVDVGRLVPFVGQVIGDRRPALQDDLQPHLPVAEVGDHHQRPSGDPQHFLQDRQRVTNLLQRLGEDGNVEHAAGNVPQTD